MVEIKRHLSNQNNSIIAPSSNRNYRNWLIVRAKRSRCYQTKGSKWASQVVCNFLHPWLCSTMWQTTGIFLKLQVKYFCKSYPMFQSTTLRRDASMTFLHSFRFINGVSFIIGMSPFLVKSLHVKCEKIHFIIILSVFALFETLTMYSTYDTYFRHGLRGLTSSAFNILSFMRVTLENITQCLTVIFGLLSFKKHIELLKQMETIDRYLATNFNISFNYNRTNLKFYMECFLLMFVVLSVIIFKAVTFNHEIQRFDDIVFVFGVALHMILLGCKLLYVRHLGRIIIKWIRKVLQVSKAYPLPNQIINLSKAAKGQGIGDIMKIAESLADLKVIYENTFGYILLFLIIYEAICLIFNTYFVILEITYLQEDHYLRLVNHVGNLIPYLVKLPILVMTLHNSHEMVNPSEQL